MSYDIEYLVGSEIYDALAAKWPKVFTVKSSLTPSRYWTWYLSELKVSGARVMKELRHYSDHGYCHSDIEFMLLGKKKRRTGTYWISLFIVTFVILIGLSLILARYFRTMINGS